MTVDGGMAEYTLMQYSAIPLRQDDHPQTYKVHDFPFNDPLSHSRILPSVHFWQNEN